MVKKYPYIEEQEFDDRIEYRVVVKRKLPETMKEGRRDFNICYIQS